MKKIIFILLATNLPAWMIAQNIEVLQSITRSVHATIDIAANSIQMTENVNQAEGMLSNIRLSIQHGEIIINYNLAVPDEPDPYYEILPEFKLDGNTIKILPHDDLRGDWGKPLKSGERQIIWINLLDRYINLKGELEVSLTTNLWGERILPYDCSLGEPVFNNKQRLPYYLAAGAGGVSIGVGQLFKLKRDDIYNNEYRTSKSLTEALPHYDDANSNHHAYLILTYAGTAILLTDAVLYLIRQGRYKKNLKLYNQWCKDASVSLAPAVNFSNPASPQGMTGLNIRVSF